MTNIGGVNYTIIVAVVVNDSPFVFDRRGVDLFELNLEFNGKQKVAIRSPIINLTPSTRYVAARIDQSAGTYTIIDRFL